MIYSSRLIRRSAAPVFIALASLGLLGGGQTCLAQRALGIDVSSYQGSGINWVDVKGGGYVFAWAKATEGTGFIDSTYNGNANNAKAAGVIIGAYHYAHPELNSATAEANYFWNVAGSHIAADGLTLMPMLDIEGSAFIGPSALATWINTWCSTVVQFAANKGVTIKPVIYVSACNAGNIGSSVSQWGSDIANYSGNNPQTSTPWTACSGGNWWGGWNFWQYSSTLPVTGITDTTVDHDVFNGTAAQLQATMVASPLGGSPTNAIVALGQTATFVTSIATPLPVNYKWYRDGTLISGATARSYSIPNAQPSQAGPYSLTVSNSAGIRSFSFYLTVLTNPANAVIPPTGLVDWWPADGTPVDILGGPAFSPGDSTAYSAGFSGSAFHFDGTVNSVMSSSATSIPVPWTASFWVRRQVSPATGAAVVGDGTAEIKIEQYASGGINTHQVGFTIFGTADYNFGYTAPEGVWTHLALVASGSQILLYANGVQVGSIANSAALPRSYMGASYVNSTGATVDPMNGDVDEFMTFNRALSASEVSALYSVGGSFLRVPEITGGQKIAATQFQLTFRGIPGKSITIYNSVDYNIWRALATIANPTGTASYTDTAATPQFKVYRIGAAR